MLHQILQHQGCIILDGALGTEIERRGVSLTAGKLWSSQLLIDNPQVLQAIHQDYFSSGTDCCTTATYQASLEGFAAAGKSAEEARSYIRAAVRLAQAARDQFWQQHTSSESQHPRQKPLVGFSAGCYGACLCDGSEYRGDYADQLTQQQLEHWHLQRLEALWEEQVQDSLVEQPDILCFETVPCLKEVQAICHLLSTHPKLVNRRAWISCSCRDGQRLNHGEDFAGEVLPCLWACEQVVAVGVNCTDPAYICQLLSHAQDAISTLSTSTPRTSPPPVLLCYPNSGEVWDGHNRCWCTEDAPEASTPQGFAQAARSWVDAGARAVGGCCRTNPQHIAALRAALVSSTGPHQQQQQQ